MIDYQDRLFKTIKNVSNSSINIVCDIADLLEISNDAVYRRMRSEKQLTINEITKLCRYYNISFDNVLDSKNIVQFKYSLIPLISNFDNNFIRYIDKLKESLLRVKEGGIVYIASNTIPFFHLCKYPTLFAFSVYVWKTQIGEIDCKQFNPDTVLDASLCSKIDEISNLYRNIEAVEIWTKNSIDHYLGLLSFYNDINSFESLKTVLQLCDDLECLMDNIKCCNSVKFECKKECVKSQIFYNELNPSNSIILFHSDDYQEAMVNINNVNNISICDAEYCKEIAVTIESYIKQSTLVSGTGYKQFMLVYNEAISKIKELRRKLVGHGRTEFQDA